MNFTFENQGTNTYLVYAIQPNDEIDTMSLGMLTNNAIPGLAAASFTQMDTFKYIMYNVSAKVSVSQLFSGAVNKKRLVGVFSGIIEAMMAAEDYMLNPDSLLLDLDYIFADVSTCETVVICVPVMNPQTQNSDICKFFKNIIFNTQFDQTENCDHVAKILNYLNCNPILSLANFKELLDDIARETNHVHHVQTHAVPVQNVVQQAPVRPVVQQAPVQPVVQQVPVMNTQPVVKPEVKPVQEQTSVIQQSAVVVPPVSQVKMNDLPKAPEVKDEKPMSMFYLLQHYSKENAALYKAQQDAKKTKKDTKVAEPKKTKQVQKKTAAPANAAFAVPGVPESVIPQQPVKQPVVQQVVVPKVQQPQPQPKMEQPVVSAVAAAIPSQPKVQQSIPMHFGETTVLNAAIGETTTLDALPIAPASVSPYLIRSKNNEKIPINKPVFRIGKERSYVDYFIADNTAISRSHANIMCHNGEYFVVDTNSTNHTYVNGGMIKSNEEVKISDGTKIRLANEDFEFKLY